MTRLRGKVESSRTPAVAFVLLAAVCSALAVVMARLATVESYAALAVLLLAAIVLLFVAGTRVRRETDRM